MKINIQKTILLFLVVVLIVFIPFASAAPVGTSESATVTAAKNWIGVKNEHGGNNRSSIDCSHLVYQVYQEVRTKGIVFQTVPNMKNNKCYVIKTSPRPGDIVFWEKNINKNGKKYSLVP